MNPGKSVRFVPANSNILKGFFKYFLANDAVAGDEIALLNLRWTRGETVCMQSDGNAILNELHFCRIPRG